MDKNLIVAKQKELEKAFEESKRKINEEIIALERRLHTLTLEHTATMAQLADELEAAELKEFEELEASLRHIPGTPVMLIKLGSKDKDWFPSIKYYIKMLKSIKAARLDEQYNVLLTHAYADYEIVK